MHHLHPKSGATSTLFTTTLAVSFLVVAIPHLLPCPVDRRQFADSIETSNGQMKRRRRRKESSSEEEQSGNCPEAVTTAGGKRERECPVPKPTGFVGQMMGFDKKEKDRPVEVIVKSLRSKNAERDPNERSETP